MKLIKSIKTCYGDEYLVTLHEVKALATVTTHFPEICFKLLNM